jgi:hypothetical protein
VGTRGRGDAGTRGRGDAGKGDAGKGDGINENRERSGEAEARQ